MSKNSMPDGIKTVMYWVLGLGIVAFIGLIMLIIFGNLSGNIGFGQTSQNFYNQTITLSDTLTNVTDLTGRANPGLSNVIMYNATNSSTIIASGNYTIVNGLIRAGPGTYGNGSSVNVSGIQSYDTQGKIDTQGLIGNYTTSVVNTGKQFPMVGTIVGISVLLIILIGLLIFAIRKMMGVASGVGSEGRSSSSKFGGSPSADFG
jgi:hypothetical protein